MSRKLASNEIIFKRKIEQLKFNRITESDWYKEKMPANFSFSTQDARYSIYYNDDGKYIICSNFNGGCSRSRQQSKPMDLDDIFTKFKNFDKIDRKTMIFTPVRYIGFNFF